MARNPKMDLAKRQAVGINRPIARFAVGTAYVPLLELQRDRRSLEGEKPCYCSVKAEPVDVVTHKVTICETVPYRALPARRSQATPQLRGRITSYAYLKPSSIAPIKWVPAGIQTLIPAKPLTP